MEKIIYRTAVLVLALSILSNSDAYACTNILVSKGASKDGSVMVTYAADSHQLYGELYFHPAAEFHHGDMLSIYEWDTGRYLGQIPQVEKTFKTVGNMNERQVMITETTYGGRPELYDSTAIMDYGSLIYVTLQRASSAREAIDIIVDLATKYGYASSGESLSIADKEEAWIMEIIGKGVKLDKKGNNTRKGFVYVAAKVPEGYICAHANQSRIGKIDFNDKENWLYSKDVVSFAREMGYFSGKDEDFSFCDAYNPLDFSGMRGCEARVWSVFRRFGLGVIDGRPADDYLPYAMGKDASLRLPLFVKPAGKLTVKHLADAMRDHYEGTPMDMTKDAGAGGFHTPYRWRPLDYTVDGVEYVNERAIATQQTGFWLVCQGRDWLPDEIGGILWFGVDDAATSCLIPIYTSINTVPECIKEGNGSLIAYSPTSLFWKTNRVAHFAYLFYDRVEPEVRAVIDQMEIGAIDEITALDGKAYELLGKLPTAMSRKAVSNLLTLYSCDKALAVSDAWDKLDKYLLVKFMDGNIKKQYPIGLFKTNGYSTKIPEAPDQPGYSDKWKRTTAADNGEILKVEK